ncbi:MAG: type II toxin-antitoxin system RelE/ParE family toxin [Methylobacter sp.]|nr:MAG: type II toxin-antitoxin system RelE/ParE family toxin [Methylobacter sp.]
MIKTFANKTTAAVFANERERKLPSDVLQVARRKLDMLDKAERLDDLRVPPGNRLEALRGDRSGLFSLRINGQWRLCFRFENGHAYDVEIIDYH